ncbi:MAG TPA: sigma-70 family RNA polymerase sigma factor [Myxococcaceae bacterium]|nr:sigma-70 family RNA polymerase sigma factor [Myxococcaceae bacterium]
MSLLPEDAAVLRAFRQGEPGALTRVYREYSPLVVRYLARGFYTRAGSTVSPARVGPLDLDAAHQETFLRAFSPRVRNAYDGIRPYEAFLFAVARSAAVDVLRAAGKLSRHTVAWDEAGSAVDALAEDGFTPEEGALSGEIRVLVRTFLDARTQEERSLAELRFVQGLSQASAGAALGLTRQEVRTLEGRLRQGLVQYLERAGWSERSVIPALANAVPARVALLLLGLLAIQGRG